MQSRVLDFPVVSVVSFLVFVDLPKEKLFNLNLISLAFNYFQDEAKMEEDKPLNNFYSQNF